MLRSWAALEDANMMMSDCGVRGFQRPKAQMSGLTVLDDPPSRFTDPSRLPHDTWQDGVLVKCVIIYNSGREGGERGVNPWEVGSLRHRTWVPKW